MKKLYFFTLIVFVFGLNSCSQAKSQSEIKDFFFQIESVDNQLKLTSKTGCGWAELNLHIAPDDKIYLDEYGAMYTLEDRDFETSNAAKFLIAMTITDDRIQLEGLEGTTWENLSFDCPDQNCFKAVTQKGLIALK